MLTYLLAGSLLAVFCSTGGSLCFRYCCRLGCIPCVFPVRVSLQLICLRFNCHFSFHISLVEWSSYEDFLPLTGEAIVDDLRHLEHEMRGLTKGCRYYVRVSACNVKGYGDYALSSPAYAVPSSEWTHFPLSLMLGIKNKILRVSAGLITLSEPRFQQEKIEKGRVRR